MPKERSINPAQAQRKAEKAKAVKKGKAEAQSRRNEKLARRNPERLQKQLDDLKAIESSGGKLTSHEKTILESLEKDIKAVKKARETLGDAAPKFSRGGGAFGSERGGSGRGVLGKRRRDDEAENSESDVPEDVRSIPMPRDTPPPIPKEVLDKWYQKRRERIAASRGEPVHQRGSAGTNANSTPLGQNERRGAHLDGLPSRPDSSVHVEPKPVVEAKVTYEAKPVIRDLRKEAVTFMPAAVRMKMEKVKGTGGLVEPEEADALERAGYLGSKKTGNVEDANSHQGHTQQTSRSVAMEEIDDEDG